MSAPASTLARMDWTRHAADRWTLIHAADDYTIYAAADVCRLGLDPDVGGYEGFVQIGTTYQIARLHQIGCATAEDAKMWVESVLDTVAALAPATRAAWIEHATARTREAVYSDLALLMAFVASEGEQL